MTGMTITWRPREPDGTKELVDITVQGKPLEKKRMYIGAASDFLVGEAKRYIGIEISKPISLQQTVFSAVENAAPQGETDYSQTISVPGAKYSSLSLLNPEVIVENWHIFLSSLSPDARRPASRK